MRHHPPRPALLGAIGLGLALPGLSQLPEPVTVRVPVDEPTDDPAAQAPAFSAPVALRVGDTPIRVEGPGYAAPAWHDVDGDGKKDLVVGQFSGGKIQVFRSLEGGQLAEGEFLEAEGEVAQVPGVW